MRGLKWGAGLSLVLVACGASAQNGERLSRECRREIVKTCGLTMDRAKLAACVTDKIDALSPDCREAISARALDKMRDASLTPRPLPAGAQELAYGPDPKQRLDFFRAANTTKPAPLIVYIHGGGWTFGDKRGTLGTKGSYYTTQGYAFATVNYRLVPQATVEQEAADVAAAIALLRRDAAKYGIDPNRIVVMGHSAGAHLAALISSDPSYLRAAGVPIVAIRGAVLLDGAGYNVPRQMKSPKAGAKALYDNAFGSDPARQLRLSPIAHAAAPNAGSWLILPVASRVDSTAQSQDFAAALRRNGSRVTVTPVPNSTHMKLNQNLGTAGDFATAQTDMFIRTVFS